MDALVAYLLSLGKAVNRGAPGGVDVDLAAVNPLGQAVAAVKRGKELFDANGCAACHGDEAHGQEGVAPTSSTTSSSARRATCPTAPTSPSSRAAAT